MPAARATSESDAGEQEDEAATGLEPLGRCYVIWPLLNPPFPILAESQDDDEVARAEEEERRRADLRARCERMKDMAVPVIVELASKKIEIGQLRQLTPGSLVTFTKSCEDLLDLYVNNHLFCRGEAVKIGEKFGLKINEVGAEEIRERRVLNPP
jgi:flagellar motor switch protein FliN/FliY